MPIENTTGLILRTIDFSETSKVVTLFTVDFGKVKALAKGARRLKSRFEVALDLLSVCDIGVIRKPAAELDLLTEAVLVERFDGLRQDLERYYAACYVAEVLDGLTVVSAPAPALFEATRVALRKLATQPKTASTLTWYGLRLLVELGLALNLEHCTGCGNAVRLKTKTPLSLRTGGLLCDECYRSAPQVEFAQGGTIQTIRWLMQCDDGDAKGLRPTEMNLHESWQVVSRCLEHQLGRRPRMADFVRC